MSDILALSALLQEPEEEPSPSLPPCVVTPASFGPPKPSNAVQKDPKAVRDADKAAWEDETEDTRDGRPAPRFEMYYKQDVDAGDVFLGTNDKTPGSQDCTHLVYKIFFPKVSGAQDLELDVKKQKLVASSADLYLHTFLPMPVDSNNGKAQWDGSKKCLCVTLPILLDEL